MKGHDEVLAKIARPRNRGVLSRTGLFRKLAAAAEAPGVWVCGPPGSGKTTLVSSYLQHKNSSTIWYQVDDSDSDVATLFWYLRMAARKDAPTAYSQLPAYTTAYRLGVKAFARRYFEKYFALLPPGFSIVIDDYHLCADNVDLADIIASAISALPRNCNFFLLSRESPPPQFCRLLGNQLLQRIGWEDLRLDSSEVREIAKMQRPSLDETSLARLEGQVGGWAAGLVLQLQDVGVDSPSEMSINHNGHEILFGYFANEVLSRQSTASRDMLLKLALMPKMTQAMACELTEMQEAAVLLNDLQRRNYFINLQSLKLPTYSFHPMFREFLLEQLATRYAADEIASLNLRAARVLEKAGYVESAGDLYRSAESWSDVIRLICMLAPKLLRQGRLRYLANLIDALPEDVRHSQPWLSYWSGMCRMFFKPGDAHELMSRAYMGFRAAEDRQGALLAWSGAINSLLAEWADVSAIDDWIIEGEQELKPDIDNLADPAEAAAVAAMCFALYICRPYSPQVSVFAEKTHALIEASHDITFALMGANLMLIFYSWMGDIHKASLLLAALENHIGKEERSAAHQIMWASAQVWFGLVTGKSQQSLSLSAEALALAESSGVHLFDYKFHGVSAQASLVQGKPDAARKALALYSKATTPEASLLRFHVHILSAWERWLSEEPGAAREHLDLAMSHLKAAGSPPIVTAKTHIGYAILHFDAGEERDGRVMLEKAMRVAEMTDSAWLKYHCLLIEADVARKSSRLERCLDKLTDALDLARRKQLVTTDWWNSAAMSSLCELALSNSIQTAYVTRLIQMTGLRPSGRPGVSSAWPWHIRINLLDGFQMSIAGKNVNGKVSAQKKVLILLKVLAASGGRKIAANRLADIIWPDADGDDARNALKTTVQRLRKLLGDSKYVEFSDGCVGLNAEYCWIDVAAFVEMAGMQRSSGDRVRMLKQALGLYVGVLLPGEEEAWALEPRARLQHIAHELVMELGTHYESKHRWRRASRIYKRVFELEPMDEQVCRHLMTCYEETGRNEDALAVFDRC